MSYDEVAKKSLLILLIPYCFSVLHFIYFFSHLYFLPSACSGPGFLFFCGGSLALGLSSFLTQEFKAVPFSSERFFPVLQAEVYSLKSALKS